MRPVLLRLTPRVCGAALAVAVVAPMASVAASAATPTDPHTTDTAAQADDDQGSARTVELEFRSVDLNYRSASLDGASSTEESSGEKSVTLAADVLFEFDRADLSAAAQAQLATIADELSDLGPRAVTIGGHTDDVGDDAYNQTLSTQRAQAVQAQLAATLGGDFTFDVTGHGESQPVAANRNDDGSDNPTGRALNRRVVITYATD